jgi:hypothetical protein
MKKLLFFLVFSLQIDAFAQLANGTVAPDFTLTDYYGTTHQLYSYLNSGKTVFLEFLLPIALVAGITIKRTP